MSINLDKETLSKKIFWWISVLGNFYGTYPARVKRNSQKADTQDRILRFTMTAENQITNKEDIQY